MMPRYQVYYRRWPTFHPSGQFGVPYLTVADLPADHVLVCEVEASSLDDAFWKMQGENWSPRGEARPLLASLGLSHTSMSVGDVLRDPDGIYWECLDTGWRRIENDSQASAQSQL
jgi:hypothetical protein